MMKQIGKKSIVFLVVVVSYFGLIAWQLLAVKKLRYDWAYAIGMLVGIFSLVAGRFLKWEKKPEFRKGKLIKPFLVAIMVQTPIILFTVLPLFESLCNDWTRKALIAYFVTVVSLDKFSPDAIAKTFDRLEEKVAKTDKKAES